MAINSRQVQTQAQQQVQTLSPQQILAVKLLELPTVELEERIHSELLDNPALEEGKEHTEEAEGHEDDYPADENEESGTDYNDDLSLGDYRYSNAEYCLGMYRKIRRTTVLREKLPKRFLFRTVFHFTKR